MRQGSLLVSEEAAKYLSGNALVCSDNIDVLRTLPDNSVDLIYLDPPFQSDSHYVAVFGDKGMVDKQLRDIWEWTTETERTFGRLLPGTSLFKTLEGIRLQAGPTSPMAAYCVFMGRRLLEMRRVLKPTGSIYLHCDHHAVHYLRLLMDAVFEPDNFRNEIVWCYTGPGNAKRWFPRKHDTLLFYAKTKAARFNGDAVRRPYKAEYTPARGVHGARRGEDSEEKRRIHQRGGIPTDWWADGYLTNVSAYRAELIGYPTQKPLGLLERVIKASSNPGDLVMDPFCGCGTAVDAAAKLGRRYLGVDISAIAVRVMEQRLASRGGDVAPVVHGMDWSEYDWDEFEKRALMLRDEAEDGVPGWAWAEDKVAGLLKAIPNSKKTGDGGVDARYFGTDNVVVPIQVKMQKAPVGRPAMQRLLGAQVSLQNQGVYAPMSLMVSLYPPPNNLRTFADQQGRVEIGGEDYPVMQVMSVEEMLTKEDRPKLPPPDPRYLVGDAQTRMVVV